MGQEYKKTISKFIKIYSLVVSSQPSIEKTEPIDGKLQQENYGMLSERQVGEEHRNL